MIVLLIAMLAALPVFGEATYGNWAVDKSDSGEAYFAITVNDSNRSLIQTCDEDGCVWMLLLPNSCKKDAKYPIMAASDAPSSSVLTTELVCIDGKETESGFGYVVANFDLIDKLIRNPEAKRIGFVYAVNDGDFTVVRFNLDGAVRAIQAMQEKVRAAKKLNTRDKRL